MAESGSWNNIQKYGLLSTSALLDMYDVKGKQRFEIESCRRSESIILKNKKFGTCIIRDQKPLSENKLKDLLDDMTPQQFIKSLNNRTFFWVRKERLVTLLNASAYRKKSHDVLTVDTKKIIKEYENKITLCRINSGAIPYKRGRRGKHTFKRIKDYPFEEYKKTRGNDAIVELAVDYKIPDIKKYVIQVETWENGNKIKTIWKKS